MSKLDKAIASHATAPRQMYGRKLCAVSIPAEKHIAIQYWTDEQIKAGESTYNGDHTKLIKVLA